ncbi:MAG: vitamin K epoxide reductase family protein [Anaerolineales bacterium]
MRKNASVSVTTNKAGSGRWARFALIGLALVGLADSLYLTYVKLVAGGVCISGDSCEIVNASSYSQIGNVPLALLGAGAYLAMLIILWMETYGGFFEFNGPILIFGMSLFGVLYSAYLTYLELYVIRVVCPFCVVSAVVLVLMLAVSGLRVRQSLKAA